MSEHQITLINDNNAVEASDQLIDDKTTTTQSCCLRVFKLCHRRRRNTTKSLETYKLKDREELLREDSNRSTTNHTNEFKDQIEIIESPLAESVCQQSHVLIRNPSQSEILHADDRNTSDADKASVQCHANKLENPQVNSLESLKENNGCIDIQIPNLTYIHSDVNSEHNLSGDTLSLQTSLDIAEKKELLSSSNSEDTVPTLDINLSEHANDCDKQTHVKDSQALLNDVNLSLSSEEYSEKYSESFDCDRPPSNDDRESPKGNVALPSTETSESLSSEVVKEQNTLAKTREDNVNEDKEEFVGNASCRAAEYSSCVRDSDNAVKSTDSEVITENISPLLTEEPSANSTEVILLETSNIGVTLESEVQLTHPPTESILQESPVHEQGIFFKEEGGSDIRISPEGTLQDSPVQKQGILLKEEGVNDIRISPEGSEGVDEHNSEVKEEGEVSGFQEEKIEKRLEMTNYYSIVSDPLLYTQGDLDEVVKSREDEWQQRQDELERKVKEEIAMRELLEEDHRSKMDCLKKGNCDMRTVVNQYEKTIVELTEQSINVPAIDEETLSETVRAKDQLHQDLNTAETNLVDAYKRIEKLKLAVDSYKQNEESLKVSLREYQTKLQKSEERYNRLKQHASEKIDAANVEIERVRKQKEIDLAGMQAALKKAQNRVGNLEVEIAQKAHENKELSQICDELIRKVSGE